MEDATFVRYKEKIWDGIAAEDKSVIPEPWWEQVIAHYFRLGLSPEEAIRVILETMRR